MVVANCPPRKQGTHDRGQRLGHPVLLYQDTGTGACVPLISNLELPAYAAYVVQSNREDGPEAKDCFRAWSQAGRCDGEFVVRTLGLRAGRDYVSGGPAARAVQKEL